MGKLRINPEELELLEEEEPQPDLLQNVVGFARDNATIIGGVIGVVVLISIFFGYQDSSARQTMIAANIDFNRAMTEYNQALSTTEWASTERQEAMQGVVAKTDEIISAYPDSDIALEAEFLKGTAYFQMGNDIQEIIAGGAENNQSAIDTFASYLAKVEEGSFEHARASLALAYAHENNFFVTKDSDAGQEALGFFSQTESSDPYGFLRADAMLGRARMLSETGQTEDAIAIYRNIMEDRFQPLTRPDDLQRPDGSPNMGRQMVFFWEQFRAFNTSLTNVARIELSRLGIDVDEEYPLYEEEVSAEG